MVIFPSHGLKLSPQKHHQHTSLGPLGLLPGVSWSLGCWSWGLVEVLGERVVNPSQPLKEGHKAIFYGDVPLHRPYIGLIYGRYLQFRILKIPLKQNCQNSHVSTIHADTVFLDPTDFGDFPSTTTKRKNNRHMSHELV